ncbi:putative 50S ribosomal protein L7Ae [Spiroplasma litorale]|uniref:Putative 50S ribosomal protein L7Ae n=1 Tax=Spiroplasma litorale TaxID=216942 RepID=A0A0K1W0Y7_9MOLU|nr:ribosomal L7Ae/L30e/S12e/Gadd45 family protein [Spiroplasma litorale]AKX33989.1 putative 50S ribosomal protein L7Ae [Spiroplasma litorale]
MNKIKLMNSLGLAASANKIFVGTKLIEKIQDKKINLVIIATDISATQYKKITNKCNFYNIKYYDNLLSGIEISKSIGKNNIKNVGLQDFNFIKLIINNI